MTRSSLQKLDTRSTYIIRDEYQIGDPTAVVTDALTGRVTAFYRKHNGGYDAVPIGVELCCGCDEPVADGPCGCAVVDREVRVA